MTLHSFKILTFSIILATLFLSEAAFAASEATTLKDGDIIFQTSRSSQSMAVQQATLSTYSHMGVIVIRNHAPYVLEAAATVRYTAFHIWISNGVNHHYVIKRLKNSPATLNSRGISQFHIVAQQFVGKPYDSRFEWSNNRIYCSELVWKIFDEAFSIEIGKLKKLRDFKLNNPVVQKKLMERYGNNIPLDEPVIAPVDMFNSPLLIIIAKNE